MLEAASAKATPKGGSGSPAPRVGAMRARRAVRDRLPRAQHAEVGM